MSETTESPATATFEQIGEVLRSHQSFVLISHVRPDGDAIGSQLALGFSLKAMGKSVRLINEDGLPENLAFLPGSELIESPPAEPLDVEVAIALDTATKPRLGDAALHAASKAKLWLNIDHHISNPKYGDLNLIDATSPATGEILYRSDHRARPAAAAGNARCDLCGGLHRHRLVPISVHHRAHL